MSTTEQATQQVRVIPVTEAPWDDVRTVFGTRGDPSTCFCQFFKVDPEAWKRADVPAFERALCEQVTEPGHGPGPGMLAYLDDEPVGWCAVEPRTSYSRILRSDIVKSSREPLESDDVWAVTCFVVRVGYRRRGVGAALLEAAVAHARDHGARVIEAYPVDPSIRKTSAAELYHGPLPTFEAAGFETVARPSESRALVELRLTS
jgi:GNAT superfamily N-acetyltransferase